MTIKQAMERLTEIEKRYGSDVYVVFDCPHCYKSFSPDEVIAIVARMTAKDKSPPML